MQWFLEQLAKEWAVIKQAPLSFLIICGLCLLASFFFVRWVYHERLQAKDDMLGYYRERMGLRPADKTPYSGMRNSEIGAKALKMTVELRQFSGQQSRATSEATLAHQQEMMAAKTEEERAKIWRKYVEEITFENSLNGIYSRKYKADVLLLRDEILSRIPEEKRAGFINDGILYEIPTNPIGLNQVADSLERLAKLLP
jgi:hypothetical protein